MYKYDEHDVERFWAKVDKNGPVIYEELGACWVWTGCIAQGYGKFRLPYCSPVQANRFSLFLAIGEFEGVARHKCDNRACVRPSHLEPGSQKDNNTVKRNRFKNQFTTEQVIQMRREAPNYTTKELAKKYNTSESNIRNAVQGITYYWVAEPPSRTKEAEHFGPLSPEIVKDIRAELQKGVWGVGNRMAKKYGLDVSVVSRIRSGEVYDHPDYYP